MTPKLFSELGLSPELIKAIDRLGFEQASPIQAEAIPLLMSGRDVVGQSQTGSGKTAAFGIPAVEKVDPNDRTVGVLILCPTRELAVQVSEEIHKLAFFKRGIQALPIYGGQSYERQFQGLKRGANIVIGTPGRVMDHMRRGTLKLDGLKLAVLDEADVMLNMGFVQDIEFIMQSTPSARQTVFFSATMPRPIRQLIEKYARDPVTVQIEQKAMTVPTVEQIYYEVDRRYKIEALTRLIDLHDLKLGIIFCNTKRMVDDLVDHLNAQGYSADRLHGDMSQPMRDRVMNKFRKSGLEFLVATDVAARGIDVDDVEVVFNYDIPYDGEDYVHRIGRTGRKGRAGMAITFASGREVFGIRNIERYTNIRMQRGRVPSVGEVENARTDVFLGKIRNTLLAGKYHVQQPFIERLLEEGFASTDIAEAILHHLKTGDTAAEPAGKPPATPVFMDQAAPPARMAKDAARTGTPGRAASGKRSAEEQKPRRASAVKTRTAQKPAPQPTTQRPTTPRPSTPRPSTPRPSTPRPSTPQPSTPQPSTPQPSTPQPSTPQPSTPQPSTPQPSAPQPSTPQPSTPQPSTPQPSTPQPSTPQPSAPQPPAPQPPAPQPPAPQPPAPQPPAPQPPAPQPPAPRSPIAGQAREGGSGSEPRDKGSDSPKDRARLFINVGVEQGVSSDDIVMAIQGETGLPVSPSAVEVLPRHVVVNVSNEHAAAILSKLKRTRIKGKRVKVKRV